MAGWAIKEMVKLTITPLSGGGTPIKIDYLNGGTLSWEEENTSARKNGKDTITIGSPKTGTFQLDAEIVDEDFIALNMGGTKTTDENGNTKIKVKAFSPSTMYKIEGTLTVYTEGGGTKNKSLVCYSAKPQASGELAFSYDEFTAFSMTFDLTSDANDEFIDFDDVVSTGARAVKAEKLSAK